MSSERLTARITGRVQGVGFRWWVRRHADALGLSGWVMNADDERAVDLVAEGPRRRSRRAGTPDPAGPVRGTRRRGRARARAGERRVRRVRNRSIVNWRAVGCGTLAAGVFVLVGLFAILRAEPPPGCPTELAFDDVGAYEPFGTAGRCAAIGGRERLADAGLPDSLPGCPRSRSGSTRRMRLRRAPIRFRTGSPSNAVTARSRPIDGSPDDAAPDPPHRQSERRQQAGQRPATRRGPGAAASGGTGVRAPRSWPGGRAPRAGGRGRRRPACAPGGGSRTRRDRWRRRRDGRSGRRRVARSSGSNARHPRTRQLQQHRARIRRPAHPRRRDRGDRRRPRRVSRLRHRAPERMATSRSSRRPASGWRPSGSWRSRSRSVAAGCAHSRPSGAGSACVGPRCG